MIGVFNYNDRMIPLTALKTEGKGDKSRGNAKTHNRMPVVDGVESDEREERTRTLV